MQKVPERPSHIPQEDWDAVDVPEATDEEWSRAVPFRDAHPDVHAAWKRGRGRPPVERPKVHIGLRLAADVVDGVRASGPGYNARVERVLREALARGEF